MLSKLLALLKDKPVTKEIRSVVPIIEETKEVVPHSKSMKVDGPSTHIGYNYLKGLDGDYEDSSEHIRRFINLNRLLRGNYHAGKIETHYAEPEGDLRGEDSE